MRYGVWAPIPQYASGVRKWNYGRNGRRITAVVIHRMDGTLDGSDSWLRSYKSGTASTHFGVGAWGWLNRAAGRYQIRQWVDTANTAYGWAARPTDTPTALARNTLGGDLYSSYADLNWQVIAIEVEGFYYQPWPAGVTAKVKELLGAIARVHGPLVIMGHTDISNKPCPGMATVPWGSIGGYGGRIGTTAPVSTHPMGDFPVRFDSVNKWGTLHPGVNVRRGPGTNYPIQYTTKAAFGTANSKRFVMGYVPGQLYNGSTDWACWWSPNTSTADRFDGRLLYVHRSLVKF
jgi:hypothetical protein